MPDFRILIITSWLNLSLKIRYRSSSIIQTAHKFNRYLRKQNLYNLCLIVQTSPYYRLCLFLCLRGLIVPVILSCTPIPGIYELLILSALQPQKVKSRVESIFQTIDAEAMVE